MDRDLAHFRAHDLTHAIIAQDTCANPALSDIRAERVDDAFRKLADALGYTVSPRVQEAAE